MLMMTLLIMTLLLILITNSYRIDVSVGILVDPDPGSPGAGRRPFAVAPDDAGAGRLVRPGAGIVELKGASRL